MPIRDAFISELRYETGLTRKMLERVPLEKKDWKPHEKSMTLGRLSTHIAEIPQWITRIATIGDFDFAVHRFDPHTANSREELLQIFDESVEGANRHLQKMEDDAFQEPWVVRFGETVRFNAPRKVAIRGWALSHLIHHRGQLSVYLRLLDLPVPGMYGPSADER